MTASSVATGQTPRPLTQGVPTLPRLAVAWQHPETRHIQPVGLLWQNEGRYNFRYIGNVHSVPGFVPFLSFPHLHSRYRSERLFPLFAQRVMDPNRPDFASYARTLDLAHSATPWEQLIRSEGRRLGDTIMVFPEPAVDPDGSTRCKFLVHGIRHATRLYPNVEERLTTLRSGDRLLLKSDPTNEFNSRAIHTADSQNVPLGWVPDLLLDYAHAVRDAGDDRLQVQHINGPNAPVHLRLLVELTGRVSPGFRPFSGGRWGPVVE